jgi:hypothetical protein
VDCSVVSPQPTDRVLLESPAPTQTHPKQKNDARVGLEDTSKNSTFSLPIEEKLHLVKLARQFETQFSSEKNRISEFGVSGPEDMKTPNPHQSQTKR